MTASAKSASHTIEKEKTQKRDRGFNETRPTYTSAQINEWDLKSLPVYVLPGVVRLHDGIPTCNRANDDLEVDESIREANSYMPPLVGYKFRRSDEGNAGHARAGPIER